ncbi:MAG TPA: DinB family protein [Dehalococcoidia bacterium]|nr:DinB family protein [Dehalococcoidia bacterium]
MGEVLRYFFLHNLWANLRLMEACQGLSDAQLDYSVPGTVGSLRQVLLHVVAAEGRYVTGLRGSPPEPVVDERMPWPGFGRLREAAMATGEALVALASEELAGRHVERPLGGRTVRVPATTVLVQAYQHGADHRSQAQTILTQLGLEPPALDVWAYARALGQFLEA